ncbi:MAG: DsbA family protein [Aaplasma endosymbiont of Hyalomma asiaticum]
MGSFRYFRIVSLIVAVCVIAIFGHAASAGENVDSGITAQQLLSLMPKDRYLGNEDAPVVIVEYASFTCSHCADFATKVFPLLKSEYIDTGKVLYIYRDFPLDKLSLTAAMLGSCYRDNKTFFSYVRAVFGSFDTLIATYKDLGLLTNIAKISNISDEEFKKCTSDESLMDDIVQQKYLAVTKLDVNATPIFFINGRKYESAHTFDVMSEEIEREIALRLN